MSYPAILIHKDPGARARLRVLLRELGYGTVTEYKNAELLKATESAGPLKKGSHPPHANQALILADLVELFELGEPGSLRTAARVGILPEKSFLDFFRSEKDFSEADSTLSRPFGVKQLAWAIDQAETIQAKKRNCLMVVREKPPGSAQSLELSQELLSKGHWKELCFVSSPKEFETQMHERGHQIGAIFLDLFSNEESEPELNAAPDLGEPGQDLFSSALSQVLAEHGSASDLTLKLVDTSPLARWVRVLKRFKKTKQAEGIPIGCLWNSLCLEPLLQVRDLADCYQATPGELSELLSQRVILDRGVRRKTQLLKSALNEGRQPARGPKGTLGFNKKNLKKAARIFKEVLVLAPRHPWVLSWGGRLRLAQGDVQEALKLYQTLVDTSPFSAYGYLGILEVLKRMPEVSSKKKALVFTYLAQAKLYCPRHSGVQEGLSKLRHMFVYPSHAEQLSASGRTPLV